MSEHKAKGWRVTALFAPWPIPLAWMLWFCVSCGGAIAEPKPAVAVHGPVVPYSREMTRPTRISGPDPIYTESALQECVEGLAVLKCVITTEGTVTNCRVRKPLKYMTESIREALEARTYVPAKHEGKPVNVDYVFNINMVACPGRRR